MWQEALGARWRSFAFMHMAEPYPRADDSQCEALASELVLDCKLAGLIDPTMLVSGGPGHESRSDAVERRRLGARFVLSQLADLVDNVRTGICRNSSDPRPAESNRRLLDTASAMALDLLENAKVDGRRLFVSAVQAARTPAGAYGHSTCDKNAVQQASAVIREAADTFKRLSPSSSAEVQTADTILAGLAQRIRFVATGEMDGSRTGPVDHMA
ncbi:MAG: hypothetical protein JSS66_13675 [Armatimonadetes bacterium]|nr:hypothetical protein [Armatimonadota bacterium]